jgi:hypothetical protein
MVSITALWIPVLVLGVVVFIASSILHMVLPFHRTDYRQLPEEEKILASLREAGLQRGLYMFPFCTHKDMKSPAIGEKFKLGPVGMLTVFPSGPPAMPKFLGMWFGYCIIISLFTVYLTGRAVPFGAPYYLVFRVSAIASFMSFGLGPLVNGIWRGQPASVVLKEAFDGLIYALLIGGSLGWLWPR